MAKRPYLKVNISPLFLSFFFVVILIKLKPRRRNEFTNKLKVTKIIKISECVKEGKRETLFGDREKDNEKI